MDCSCNGRQGRKGIQGVRGGSILDVEFLMLDCWEVTLLRLADDTSKGWRPTTLLTRFAEELRRVGQKYEGAKDQAKC